MHLCLSFNIDLKSGFQFNRTMVIPNCNLLKPSFYQCLIENFEGSTLLLNEILQLIDTLNLCVSGGSVNSAIFSLFTELKNLVCNLIIGFLVVSLFEKLFLEFHQLLVNAIRGDCSGSSDD